jgi:putative phosphoribosyl transferase
MRAATAALRQMRPAGIVVAVPVAPASTGREMAAIADHAGCVLQPETFAGVGKWYRDFRQTSDEEVQALLAAAREAPVAAGSRGAR